MCKILAIARYTLLEAARGRLSWLVLGTVTTLSLASLLVRELAVTDALRIQIAFLAALLRGTSALLGAAFIISTLQREFNDKVPLLLLALDVPRSYFVLGKLAGLGATAFLIALACALPLLALAPFEAWWPWAAALILEGLIVAAVSVFCGLSLRSVTAGLLFSIAFYGLAKSMASIQLISHASLLPDSLSHRYLTALLDGLAFLLPRLDQFAPTGWLVDGHAQAPALAGLAMQAAVYVALVTAAATIDLYRKNL